MPSRPAIASNAQPFLVVPLDDLPVVFGEVRQRLS